MNQHDFFDIAFGWIIIYSTISIIPLVYGIFTGQVIFCWFIIVGVVLLTGLVVVRVILPEFVGFAVEDVINLS